MADEPLSSAASPEPVTEAARRRRWPSPVWLAPLAALGFSLFLLFQSIYDRGPLIEIEFETAEGLKPGETVIRYRDVDVGRIEDVRFSPDLSRVVAEARMERDVAPYLDASARFWVVTPRVSAQGVTGLETVLGGAYVEASWDAEPGPPVARFTAETRAPLTPDGAPGLRVTLRAEDGGSLEIGSPLFFKRVEVGRVESKRLADDGAAVLFEVFISAPNDRRVTTETRFWNASGVDLSLGADGASLRIASLSSLIRGGASFDTAPGGDPVEDGHVFFLFSSESAAKDVISISAAGDQAPFEIFFNGSVRGLSPGASVEYRGIRVGRVERVTASIDPSTDRFRTRTRISLSPSLLGIEAGGREALMRFLRSAVAEGLRAKLALGNLLTGALYVALEDEPETPFNAIDETGQTPILPAIASDLDELAGSVEGVMERVNALPVEALLNNAVTLLENLNRIAGSDGAQAAPERLLAILTAAEGVVADPALGLAVADAAALTASLRALAEDPALAAAPGRLDALLASLAAQSAALEDADAAENAAAALAALRALAEDPALAATPGALTETLAAANALLADPALGDLASQATATLAAARAALSAPGLTDLPAELGAAVASLRARLDDPALAEATAALPRLVTASAETAERLAADLGPALGALREVLEAPALVAAPEELRATLAAARAVLEDDGFRRAGGEAAAALAALRAVLEAPGASAAPAELTGALAAARSLLASLEAAGAAESLSRTLDATRRLAEDPALPRAAAALSGALEAVETVLAAPGAEALPRAATDALTAAAALIGQFQAENLGAATTGALSGVVDASRAVEQAMAGLPRLLARLADLTAEADALLASVGVGSELNYETVSAIRDIRDAARAVTDVADLVRRKPNAIIIGK